MHAWIFSISTLKHVPGFLTLFFNVFNCNILVFFLSLIFFSRIFSGFTGFSGFSGFVSLFKFVHTVLSYLVLFFWSNMIYFFSFIFRVFRVFLFIPVFFFFFFSIFVYMYLKYAVTKWDFRILKVLTCIIFPPLKFENTYAYK